MEESVAKLPKAAVPSCGVECVGLGDVQSRRCARGGAYPGHVRSISFGWWKCSRSNFCSLRLRLRGAKLERRTIRTMSVDETRVRDAAAPAAAGQTVARPELRRVFGAFPSDCRKSADKYGTMSGPPLWSFGGQSREHAKAGIRAKTLTMEVGQVSRKVRTCQPNLVRACSIGPGTHRALQQPPALGAISWSCLFDTALAALASVLDLISLSNDLQRFLLNRGIQCARPDPFSDDDTAFSTRIREILRMLASGRTLAVMLSPPVSFLFRAPVIVGLCGARHNLGDCQGCLSLTGAESPETNCVAPHVCRCLGSYLWEPSGIQNMISKCVVWDVHHRAFESHRRKATHLPFEDSLIVLAFTFYPLSFLRCHGKHGFREGHKHLLLQGSLARQAAKYPPGLIAFIAGLLMDP